MKKIIIAMCGMCVICGAFASSRAPHVLTDNSILTAWNFGDPYSENVYNTFTNAAKWSNGKSNPTDSDLASQEGTYGGGEGAIIGIVARKIVKNGGWFCATQIQAANENWNLHSWIDYYKNAFGCAWVCKPGFKGENCEEVVTSTDCDASDFTTGKFAKSLLSQVKTSGKSEGRFTEDMDVFSHEGGYGSGDNRSSWDVVLGVIGWQTHGLEVAPVKIEGRRWGTQVFGNRSRIKSMYATKTKTLLCASGYIAKSGTCVESDACKTLGEIDKWCNPNYKQADFTDGMYNKEEENGCYIFRCAADGYGFKSDTDKTCEKCGTDVRSGALRTTGVCTTCPVGQCFKNGECGGCTEIPKLKIERGPKYDTENRECWRETNMEKFWGCVMCPDENQCYNKNSSGKYECGTCPTE